MGVMIDQEQQVELKLEYANQLRQLVEVCLQEGIDHEGLYKRCERVFDSIEKDLGISKPFSVGDIKVNVSVDTNNIQKQLKELDKVWEETMDKLLAPHPNL